MKAISVLIPCYNEADSIAEVIQSFPDEKSLRARGYTLDVLVIDNNSGDNTSEVARKAGARVILEPKQGKGNAIRTGFYNISESTDFIVMLDGDNTYLPGEILRLVEPLDSGFSDVIVGSRLGGKMKTGSMKGFNRLGNWMFSFLVRTVYRVNVTDVLTGYFAWKREPLWKLRPHLKSDGFAIEMEMITKMARLGLQIYSVPISYEPRTGESSLHPLQDGWKIMKVWAKQLKWRPSLQRIAFVSDAVYPFNKGGKEFRLFEISKRLVRDGREIHIYTMKWWAGPKHIIRNGVHLHAISKKYPLYKNDKRSYAEAIGFGMACFKMLWKRFDIVDVDSIPFIPLVSMRIVCFIRRKKMLASWHEVWGTSYWREYAGVRGVIAAQIERIAAKLPDVIISNSQHTTNQLHATGVTKPIATIPLGVDLESIYDAPKNQLKSDVMFAGRLLDHKNVDLLIKAIGLVKPYKQDIYCVIVGDGPERSHLEELAASLKLQDNISFFNFLEDHAELYGLMKASKVLVLPSVREGFGLVVVEANACGIPVITTNHKQNAARQLIIEGQNGLLTEVDEYQLANHIIHLISTDDLKAEAIRQKADQYSWANVTRELEKIY